MATDGHFTLPDSTTLRALVEHALELLNSGTTAADWLATQVGKPEAQLIIAAIQHDEQAVQALVKNDQAWNTFYTALELIVAVGEKAAINIHLGDAETFTSDKLHDCVHALGDHARLSLARVLSMLQSVQDVALKLIGKHK